MKKWKLPQGCTFEECRINDDCIVFYFKESGKLRAYLVPIGITVKEPTKTYEEGFIAGFSHNIETVTKLEKRLKQIDEILQKEPHFSELLDGWKVMKILKGEENND